MKSVQRLKKIPHLFKLHNSEKLCMIRGGVVFKDKWVLLAV